MATEKVNESVVNATEEVLEDVTNQVTADEGFNWVGAGIIVGVSALVIGAGVWIYKKVTAKKAAAENKPEETTTEEVTTEEPVEAQA